MNVPVHLEQPPALLAPAAVPMPTNSLSFWFRLRAVNASGTSAPTATIFYSTTADQFESIPLRWTPNAPSDLVTNYVLEVSTNSFSSIYQQQSYGLACDVPYPFYWTNIAYTIAVQGTGDVWVTGDLGSGWTLSKSNFHGIYGSWTNSLPSQRQFLKGPGLKLTVTQFN